MKTAISNDKKKALLAHKEKILQEIKYYEKRITEFSRTNYNTYSGFCSSDSEDDFPTTFDIDPSISELKQRDRLLRTCLQATQELTSVGVLQSEVNFMVQDPPFEGEKPVSEPGSWREVTAECRIDLVPFSITFYTHQPSRKFAGASFRGLRVLLVKTANEAELSKSVLSTLTNPSDAIEVLRSYAVAYRSRRTTLARLADRYAADLNMEPLPEGGFVLKCANLLTMSWRLENQLSVVAPFHHKMNFELDYMDESYLKIIKQAHRQLSDPSLQTDERTLLLAKIISTCLEAQTPTQEPYESMESDAESVKKHEKTNLDDSDNEAGYQNDELQARKRKNDEQTALENTDDEGVNRDTETRKRKRDEEVMAPPKAIPKKAKPKGKENMNENRKAVKRSGQVDGSNAKKAKTDVNRNDTENNERYNETEVVKKSELEAKNDGNKAKKAVNNQKTTVEKELRGKDTEKNKKQSKSTEKTVGNSKNSHVEIAKVKKKVAGDAKVGAAKNIVKTTKEPQEVSQENASNNDVIVKKVAKKATSKADQIKPKEKNIDEENNKNNNEKKKLTKGLDAKSTQNSNGAGKNVPQSSEIVEEANSGDIDKNIKKANEKNIKNYEKTTASSQAKVKTTDKILASKNSQKIVKPNEDKTDNSKPNARKVDSNPKINTEYTAKRNEKNTNSKPANAKNDNSETTNAKNVNSESTNAKNTNSKSTNAKNVNSEVTNVKNTNSNTAKNDNIKNVATKNDIKNVAAKKAITNTKNTLPVTKNTANNVKNPKKQEKLVIKNHRHSGRVAKNISANLKFIDGKSKIPQKKLSPAYAAVLQQNPIRVTPSMMAKFKSPSDTNIQKLKPVTNIPRLLKKPASLI